jgi:hypothetical protein
MDNGELANVSEAFWMGRMIAVPFFRSIYFHSPFSILLSAFFILHSLLRRL